MADRTALIVGAGIGGLAAAVALTRAGWRVRVFERASAARELGFALGLAPNAQAALAELGLGPALQTFGAAVRRAEMRRLDGRVLRRFDVSEIAGTEDAPSPLLVALRPALHGALLNRLAESDPEALVLGREVEDVQASSECAQVVCRDGRRARADLVIGADGVGSVVRRALHPEEPPARPSGYVAVRGVAPDGIRHLGGLDGVGYLGPGVEGGTIRAGTTEVYWYLSFLAADAPTEIEAIRRIDRLSNVVDRAFRTLIAETPAADRRFDALFSREPLRVWGHGRVTLLGDAAHPVLPHSGQGAAQALEDAVALGLVLASSDGPPDLALRRYEGVRGPRTAGIVRYGRRVARVTTTANPAIRAARDVLIQLVPMAMLRAAYKLSRPVDPHARLR